AVDADRKPRHHLGLGVRSGKDVKVLGQLEARIADASRVAFDSLVALAIAQRCRFVVLAGDVFDGDLRNYQTGLFFMDGVRRLGEAGMGVYLVLGNHDAENRFAARLELAQNLHVFAAAHPQTQVVPGLTVSIHGQSFARRDVTTNLALGYPSPTAGHFNIGVLHTACQGSEGQHAPYAPCSLEQLINHGYDYWALGHVHARTVLHAHPHVIYPGNLQGRSCRETGGKGATVVHVAAGRVEAAEHHDLDQVRWASPVLDLSGIERRDDLLEAARRSLEAVCHQAQQRAVALRLTCVGATPLHAPLLLQRASFEQDIEALLATLPSEVWLEKLVLATCEPAAPEQLDPSVAGRLLAEIDRLATNAHLSDLLAACLADIKVKVPDAA
ncbi:MAG: DNA repair exonuclease, partial [Deltaproteobacteria bacterium]